LSFVIQRRTSKREKIIFQKLKDDAEQFARPKVVQIQPLASFNRKRATTQFAGNKKIDEAKAENRFAQATEELTALATPFPSNEAPFAKIAGNCQENNASVTEVIRALGEQQLQTFVTYRKEFSDFLNQTDIDLPCSIKTAVEAILTSLSKAEKQFNEEMQTIIGGITERLNTEQAMDQVS
jgi:hypothetical protein